MKKIFLIYLLSITSIIAQQKIGHVHVQKIMDVMPDVVTAMEELTSDQTMVETTLTSLYEEYQNKIQSESNEYINNINLYNEEINKKIDSLREKYEIK